MWGLQPQRMERWKLPMKDGRGEGQETEPLRILWSSPINLALPTAVFLLYDWEINSPFNLLLFGVLCHFKLNLILTGLLVNYRNASSCSKKTNKQKGSIIDDESVKSLSRVWLCNPMDYSVPGSSVHDISQARILEREKKKERERDRERILWGKKKEY